RGRRRAESGPVGGRGDPVRLGGAHRYDGQGHEELLEVRPRASSRVTRGWAAARIAAKSSGSGRPGTSRTAPPGNGTPVRRSSLSGGASVTGASVTAVAATGAAQNRGRAGAGHAAAAAA